MEQFWDAIAHYDLNAGGVAPETMLLVMLLAFCMGNVVGWIYMWTHVGLSYSQTFVASLVALPVITAVLMLLMAGDIAVAFGLFAVFAAVRFRNVLKDTRDTVFVLWAMVEGMAAGTMRVSLAVLGGFALALMFLYLRFTAFGGRHTYDMVLSLQVDGDSAARTLTEVLRRYCLRISLSSQRELMPSVRMMSYQLLLRDPLAAGAMVNELRSTGGVADVAVYHGQDEAEL